MLELTQVTKRFGATQVLSGLDLKVEPNEIVGLLGPNGSGKTTSLRIAAGVAQCDSGTVVIDGQQVTPELPNNRATIGYMPERVPLYGAMRVERQLRFVAAMRGLDRAAITRTVGDAIERLHLQEMRRELVGHLSKGFRQRVGLAQAMLGDPKVLLLDEPTSGLDPFQIMEARDYIRDAAAGRAVLVSTHIVQEMESMCSRVVYLHNGRLTELAKSPESQVEYQVRLRLERSTSEELLGKINAAPLSLKIEDWQINDGVLEFTCSPQSAAIGPLTRLLVEYGQLLVFAPLERGLEHDLLDFFTGTATHAGER